jgi:hypothetical protein
VAASSENGPASDQSAVDLRGAIGGDGGIEQRWRTAVHLRRPDRWGDPADDRDRDGGARLDLEWVIRRMADPGKGGPLAVAMIHHLQVTPDERRVDQRRFIGAAESSSRFFVVYL